MEEQARVREFVFQNSPLLKQHLKEHGFVALRVVAFDRGDPAEVVQARMLQLRDAGITKIIISAPVPETRQVVDL